MSNTNTINKPAILVAEETKTKLVDTINAAIQNGLPCYMLELELDGDVVHNVKFTGGCNGNLKAIPKLVEGLTVAQVEEKIGCN